MAAQELRQGRIMMLEQPDSTISGVLSVVFAGLFPQPGGGVLTLPEREGCWNIICLQEGAVTFTRQGGKWSLCPGQAIVLGAESGGTVVFQKSSVLGVLTIQGFVADQLLTESRIHGGLFFGQEGGVTWSVLSALAAEEDRLGEVKALTGSEQAYRLLCRLYQKGTKPEAQRQSMPVVVESALAIIQRDFAFLDGIGELADRLGVSQEYLTRAFRKAMGLTPGKYLNQIRVDYAKMLLQQGEHSIAFVSDACGFSNSNYFARVFRNFVGVRPTKYVQMCVNHLPVSEGITDSFYVL